MTFITATTLPLLIALADIGQRDGVMLPATAAAMIGAGVLSVLVYPLIAVGLHRSAPLTPADIQAAAPSATGTSPPPDNPGHPPPDQLAPGAKGPCLNCFWPNSCLSARRRLIAREQGSS